MFYYLVHMEYVLFLFLLINCENYDEFKKIKMIIIIRQQINVYVVDVHLVKILSFKNEAILLNIRGKVVYAI